MYHDRPRKLEHMVSYTKYRIFEAVHVFILSYSRSI